ncbi:hypothetical protein IAQ61_007471 [Plenodomus lingam]|uniref:uncharacterized protein n=1 Tax=Leptosphaeria maculans TaxID=5022 RepID=UPI003325255D|nr:hypothetical protein IAQ61_007471 [Plenodomus lingam]
MMLLYVQQRPHYLPSHSAEPFSGFTYRQHVALEISEDRHTSEFIAAGIDGSSSHISLAHIHVLGSGLADAAITSMLASYRNIAAQAHRSEVRELVSALYAVGVNIFVC